MKRIIAMLLALLLMLTCFAVIAEGTEETEEIKEKDPKYEELVVANPTAMRGEFFTEMWGNSTTDIDVRVLIHGYNLVTWDNAMAKFIPDAMVVDSVEATDLANGNRLYAFHLKDDLYYCDGTQITAWDYAFSILFTISPEIVATGGTPVHEDFVAGYEEYFNGEVDYYSGVRVLDDFTIQFEVTKDYVPFFYEFGLFYITPCPIYEIAPGCVVKDDGQGIYIANEDETIEEPIFTSELIMKTVLDPETGYASHPKAVCGPYMLTGFDGVTATFEINPYFKGDVSHNEVLPTIQRLVFTLADNENMIEKLESGEIGLLNKVTKATTIDAGIELVGSGEFAMGTYPRSGLSFIGFFTEKNTVASRAVRQAISYCVDRDVLTEGYTGNYGLRMDGWTGLAHWPYRVLNGVIPYPVDEPEDPNNAAQVAEYEEEMAKWEALSYENVRVYTLDVEKAISLLVEDGWTLNREGKEFDPEKDDVRCKEIDGELVALDLKLWYPAGNRMSELMEENFLPNLAEAGIKLTMEGLPMVQILGTWYDQGEREGDMIYLATNFDVVWDPAVNFVEDLGGNHTWNYTNDYDELLYQRALDMRETEPDAVLEYMQEWILFQEEFMEEVAILPIYSNMYFDFYTIELQNYDIPSNVTWTQAIVPAIYDEYVEPEPELLEGDEEEDFFED
ncbi:MAG: ABC transporter substrate-binding protein [Clostridia bacterium]|nr:ABC transporter substrate-binding protein [Clostridia bacterium]